jgi:hypothetical protein
VKDDANSRTNFEFADQMRRASDGVGATGSKPEVDISLATILENTAGSGLAGSGFGDLPDPCIGRPGSVPRRRP